MFAHISCYIYLLTIDFYFFRLSTVFPSVQAACKRRENSLQVRKKLKQHYSKNVVLDGLLRQTLNGTGTRTNLLA